MASLPPGRAEVVQAALPEERVIPEQPLIVSPFAVKATVPVGEEPPLTVAVNVTASPAVEGFREELRVVVVDSKGTNS